MWYIAKNGSAYNLEQNNTIYIYINYKEKDKNKYLVRIYIYRDLEVDIEELDSVKKANNFIKWIVEKISSDAILSCSYNDFKNRKNK